MSLSGAGKLAGVIGWPVTQSLSPQLHGFWLDEHGIDGALVPLAVRPEDFSTVLNALIRAGFKGASVTIPHKEAAFALCHDCDLAGRVAGAVNLLIFHDDRRIEGRNSDAAGFSASLQERLGVGAGRDKVALILGAGGAARAIAVALSELGASEIRIVNRSRDRAEQLAAALARQLESKFTVFELGDWSRAAVGAELVVQATSAGTKGSPSLNLSLAPLPRTAAVCDIVYNPLETDFLKRADAAGFTTIDGLGMLMHQAVPAFAAFFGITPKVSSALRRQLEKALAREK